MPFTPFHFGPALFLGLLLLVELDFPTFLAASVIVDTRAVLVFFDVLGGPIHGPLHTAVGGLVVAGVLTAGSFAVRRYLDPVLAAARLQQEWSVQTIAAASLAGVALHLLLDAVLYADMALLWPVAGNPLAGLYGLFVVYGLCVLTGVLGLVLYGGYLLGFVALRTPLRDGG